MNVKQSLFKNEKTEVESGIVPQSCLMSDGVRIRTQLSELDPGLILTPYSLPSSDKEDEDELWRAGKRVGPFDTWPAPWPSGHCLTWETPFLLSLHQHLECFIWLQNCHLQSNLNAWSMGFLRTGGQCWLINGCLYNVFLMKTSFFQMTPWRIIVLGVCKSPEKWHSAQSVAFTKLSKISTMEKG